MSVVANPVDQIDFSALSSPVTRAELRAYIDRDESRWYIFIPVAFVVIFAITAIVGNLIHDPLAPTVGWVGIGISLVITPFVLVQIFKDATLGIRLQRFTRINNFRLTMQRGFSTPQQEPGTLFHLGTPRGDQRVVSGTFGGRAFEYGTHTYTTGSGKTETTHEVSFVRLELVRQLPHVVIDGRKNVLNLSEGINRSQRLSLEGDFDKYFTVYCPKGYERDVLYFLTPELMQLIIDKDQAYDMEIVGNYLYFYQPTQMVYDEATQRRIFELMHRTGGEFDENTQHYSTEVSSVQPVELRRHMSTSMVAGIILAVLAVVVAIISLVMR